MNDDDLFFGADFLSEDDEPEKLSLKEGELREVSVLFADIKGFTNISNLFAPEVIHGKMDEIMKIFTRCINFYGGFVDKYMGDGIMALFGAKKATEQDSERCILAALKMQEQLRLYNSLLVREPGFQGLELGLRIGINTGLVSVGKVGQSREGDFTVYGPQVNLASRMESNAPVNRIMMPIATMKLVEHIFEFEPQGLVHVKGMDDPIDCWLVKGIRTEKVRPKATIFLGRETELAFLSAAFQQSQSGLKIVGIKGDAGIGKSRLVSEFCLSVPNPIILRGMCSGISPSPFNAFTRIFESQFGISHNAGSDTKKAALEQAFADLSRDYEDVATLMDAIPLIGLLMEIRYDDPRIKQKGKDLLNHILKAIDTVFFALLAALQASKQNPILIIDDLHLIDEASASALEHLIQKISTASIPFMILGLYRLDFPIVDSITEHSSFSEMEVSALTDAKMEELVMHYAKDMDLSPSNLKLVKQLSAGNPFFLEEWCNFIGSLPKQVNQDYPVPGNLHALILSRLDNLPQNLRLLLHKASVIGNEFFVDILREVEKRLSDPVDVDTTLKDLEDHSLIMKMLGFDFSTYFFKHITTREVAYQTLLQQNRKMLHQLTAESIEALFPTRTDEFVYTLAEHYLKAELPELAKPYLLRGIELASKVYDNNLALKLAAELLKLYGEEEAHKKAELLIQCADIRWLIGDWPDANDDITAARQLLAEGDIALCDVHRFQGMAAFFRGEADVALSEFSAGLALATKLDDSLQLCIAKGNLGIWYQHHKDYSKAIQMHSESLEIASALGQVQRQGKTFSNLGLIYLEQGEIDKAESAFMASLEISQTNRYMRDESIALGNLAWAYIVTERFDEARPYLEKKLSMATKMNDTMEIIKALGNLGNIYNHKQQYEIALEYYRQILPLKQGLGNAKEIAITLATIADTEAKWKLQKGREQ